MLGAGLVFLYDVNGLSSEEKLFIYDRVKPPGTMSISTVDKHLQVTSTATSYMVKMFGSTKLRCSY